MRLFVALPSLHVALRRGRIPKAGEVRLKPKVRNMLEARCRHQTCLDIVIFRLLIEVAAAVLLGRPQVAPQVRYSP